MENNDREIVAIEIDEDAHYRKLVHQLIPGARQQDAHTAWLRSLTEQSNLFVVPPDYKTRLVLDLRHAVAMAVGINPTAKLDWLRRWQVDYRRDNSTTPPFAAKRLTAFIELLDMALIDIADKTLNAHKDPDRAGGHVVKRATFDAWIKTLDACHEAPAQEVTAAPEPQAVPVVAKDASGGAPMLKQAAQEFRILELLASKSHDPLNLADRPSGKGAVKSEIRKLSLLEPALFTTKTFDTAWQRLRQDDRLVGGK